MSDEKPKIPADEALSALSDTDLLELMEASGIDSAGVADRSGAVTALQAKRDAAPEPTAGETPPADPATKPEAAAGDAQENEADNTAADQVQPEENAQVGAPEISENVEAEENGAVTPSPIPDDAELGTMRDSAIMNLLDEHQIDDVADRGAAIAALIARRDNLVPNVIDTRADEAQGITPMAPKLSAMLAEAVRAAKDPVQHAALHNFEAAFADFRRAASNLSEIKGAIDSDSPLGAFMLAVITS